MLNRELVSAGEPPANHKRVYRLMKMHGLLLERHSGNRPGRTHDGKVVVMRSNFRLCSDVRWAVMLEELGLSLNRAGFAGGSEP